MPYIPPAERHPLDPSLNWLIRDLTTDDFTAGMLNYVFSSLANAYMIHHGLRYAHIKDVQGVYTGALDEFNERVARPYEARKIEENGDIWTINQEHVRAALPDTVWCEATHQSWIKCRHPECDLHLTGPGRIECIGHCIDDDEDWNQI